MGNTITITFRAKRDDFAGGEGYKVPRLTSRHVTFAERDTLSVLMADTLGRPGSDDITKARLKRFAGLHLPGVVWVEEPGDWTVTPIGSGYMADVTITRPLSR